MQTLTLVNIKRLKTFAKSFRDSRENHDSEAAVVNKLSKFFDEVLGYSLLKGEISSQYEIRNRFVDLAILLEDKVKLLIEVKPADSKLSNKDIYQAENYASEEGFRWVLLTNGIDWKLFHLNFGQGIEHKEVLNFNFADEIDQNLDKIWSKLTLFTKKSMSKNKLDDFYLREKALSACNLLKALSSEKVLNRIRTEVNRKSKVRINIKELVEGLNKLISEESRSEAGNIVIKKENRKLNINTQILEIQRSEDQNACVDQTGHLEKTLEQPGETTFDVNIKNGL